MKKRILLSLAALLLCVTLLSSCNLYPDGGLNNSGNKTNNDITDSPSLIGTLIEQYSYYNYELTEDELSRAVVAAYKELTGDLYARYYTAAEYEELNRENVGNNQGVGITITENTEYNCIEIISVLPNTPAMEAGLLPGDLIVQVGIGEKAEKVSDIGYEIALTKMRGESGTTLEIGVVRNGEFENIIEFSIVRAPFTSESVTYAVSAADSSVGIVKILNFDLTTPTQFKAAMEDLISKKCTSFVYDVRNNPGGDLASISAVLAFFLNEGDTIIITEDRSGKTETDICEPVRYSGDYSSCNIVKEEIGKYRSYPSAVLINGNTASAAELFTGTLKAYGLSTIVGETSYGKGCMQSIIPLSNYGSKYTGALKLTTKYYRPYNMTNYHGIGITPSEGYEVILSEEAASINHYKLLEAENQKLDNQLSAAISAIKNK